MKELTRNLLHPIETNGMQVHSYVMMRHLVTLKLTPFICYDETFSYFKIYWPVKCNETVGGMEFLVPNSWVVLLPQVSSACCAFRGSAFRGSACLSCFGGLAVPGALERRQRRSWRFGPLTLGLPCYPRSAARAVLSEEVFPEGVLG